MLPQSLTVQPVCDAGGNETGMFEILPAAAATGRSELLVKQKRLAKTAPIPCVIREGGIAEEIASPRTCSARRFTPSTSSGRS